MATMKVVCQRCDAAELLVDNDKEWIDMGYGLIIFVSFQEGCSPPVVSRAAKSLLNLPLLVPPGGLWGDGIAPTSVIGLARRSRAGVGEDHAPVPTSPTVMVVPTASLTCKINGKYVQYRGQCGKDLSRELYNTFIAELRAAANAALSEPGSAAATKPPSKKAPAALLSVPPADLFKKGGRYTAWADDGTPTHDAECAALSKAQIKKTAKEMARYIEKWDKQASARLSVESADAAGNDQAAAPKEVSVDATMSPEPAATTSTEDDSCLLRTIAGTFGNRQGLRVTADMGPFVHNFEF